jgi:toxin secretion/phage lysis holin
MSILIWINLILASLGVVIGWFLGDSDTLMYTLVVFIVVDYIIGVMKRMINKELNRSISTNEILKKMIIILLVGVANVIDIYLLESDKSLLKTAVIFFYISNQGISILENAVLSGLPIPETLRRALLKLKLNVEKCSKKE